MARIDDMLRAWRSSVTVAGNLRRDAEFLGGTANPGRINLDPSSR
jgi:hypothetical protein